MDSRIEVFPPITWIIFARLQIIDFYILFEILKSLGMSNILNNTHNQVNGAEYLTKLLTLFVREAENKSAVSSFCACILCMYILASPEFVEFCI